jgi:hypothetical protein
MSKNFRNTLFKLKVKLLKIVLLFILVIFVSGLSHEQKNAIKTKTNLVEASKKTKYEFKKAASRIEKAILTLNPSVNPKKARRLSAIVAINSVKYKIDPRIMLSILNVESSFDQSAVSSTNDISIAQINLNVWTPSFFKNKTGKPLDVKRLKRDEAYAISRMCLILNYYKGKFPNDKFWYARYHSSTPKFKSAYLSKLIKSVKKIKFLGSDIIKDIPKFSDLKIAFNKDPKNMEFLK